jgi:hypothetical protein
MKAAARLAQCLFLLGGAVLGACAGEKPAAEPPKAHEAQPPPRDDGRAQLVRTLDALKQPGVEAVKDTQEARSVIEAIGGVTQMQGDAGLRDH